MDDLDVVYGGPGTPSYGRPGGQDYDGPSSPEYAAPGSPSPASVSADFRPGRRGFDPARFLYLPDGALLSDQILPQLGGELQSTDVGGALDQLSWSMSAARSDLSAASDPGLLQMQNYVAWDYVEPGYYGISVSF